MDDICIDKIKEYMDETIKTMGKAFSHFTLTIWENGYSTESGNTISTDYDLMLIQEHNIPITELDEYINTNGWESLGTSYKIARFPMYKDYNVYCPSETFEKAQKIGRKLYYMLRKEYPIRRDLGYKG